MRRCDSCCSRSLKVEELEQVLGILLDTFHVRQSDNRCCRRACKFSFPALVVSACKPRNHVKMRRCDSCCSRSLKVEELEQVLGAVLVLESECMNHYMACISTNTRPL